MVLCGTKADLRTDREMLDVLAAKRLKPLTTDDGYDLATKIGAVAYVETSAYAMRNVKEVFDACISAVLNPPSKKKKKQQKGCALM